MRILVHFGPFWLLSTKLLLRCNTSRSRFVIYAMMVMGLGWAWPFGPQLDPPLDARLKLIPCVQCTWYIYSVSQKIPPEIFWHFFPKWLEIFSPNFACLLHVPIYAGLQVFIQLLVIWRSYAILSATTIMCLKCRGRARSVHDHFGTSGVPFRYIDTNYFGTCQWPLRYIGSSDFGTLSHLRVLTTQGRIYADGRPGVQL